MTRAWEAISAARVAWAEVSPACTPSMYTRTALLARVPERVWLKPMATAVPAPLTPGTNDAGAQPPRITRVGGVQRFRPVAGSAAAREVLMSAPSTVELLSGCTPAAGLPSVGRAPWTM